MKKKLFVLLLVMAILLTSCQVSELELDGEKMVDHSLDTAGLYGVGYMKLFVTDESQVFNAWGEKYGNKEHQTFFKELNAFEPHTVVTQMWYPSAKVKEAQYDHLGQEPMASGDDVYMRDLYIQDEYFQKELARSSISSLTRKDGKDMRTLLNESTEEEFKKITSELVDEALNRKLDSKMNAPVAEGKFPVIVMAHGLGGTGYMWNESAEALASQGYIVVAPTFVSDGSMPEVFSNPNSIVGKKSEEEVHDYYLKLQNQGNVVENFFKYLYGTELDMKAAEASGSFDEMMNQIKASKAPADGGILATEMMGDLFDQRVKDVEAIIVDLKVMNLKGDFAGKIDIDSIGMTGHSLGSITTMVALERLDDIKVGLGINNGVPVKWEPDDLEDKEITKPLFLLHGQEDDFLDLIFKNVWQDMYIPQGGDINKTYVLADERVKATPDNPDPILTATYNRANGPKIAVEVQNSDHGNLIEDTFSYYPTAGDQDWKVTIEKPRMLSKGLLNTGLFIEKFNLISSEKLEDGYILNQAGFIRDYYLKAWFGYYLKGQEEYFEFIFDTPFEEAVKVKSDNF
ncbi:hypothetical protein EZV73_27685 [Acidaminobacter sp. JC074]|uniref:alpha/beta hydrolase n=1 Tax=Acidaminobacter sp. JC074 TaxID=2530199 RepID=UPI001F0DD90D|nr:hypothetical protein [Acidaminobacter sp. JC074]MCH4891384.1 hypothetical protein [Acidaminobacter sp. JC074]